MMDMNGVAVEAFAKTTRHLPRRPYQSRPPSAGTVCGLVNNAGIVHTRSRAQEDKAGRLASGR
jgi:hypothetical protein